jgi:hypothetical protein
MLTGDSHRQYDQYLYQYTSEYDTSENILLDEAEQLYNKMIEACTISEMTDNTESSSHSLQPLMELPDVQHQQARKEDLYSISDAAKYD